MKSPETSTESQDNFLSMYSLPTGEEVSEREFQRYLETNQKLIEHIPEMIRKAIAESDDIRELLSAVKSIDSIPDEEKKEELKRKFFLQYIVPSMEKFDKDKDPFDYVTLKFISDIISYIPASERGTVIIFGFDNDKYGELGAEYAHHIDSIPDEEVKTELKQRVLNMVEEDVNNSDWRKERYGVKMIRYTPMELRAGFIDKALDSKDMYVRQLAAEQIKYIPEELKRDLLIKAFKTDIWSVVWASFKVLETLSDIDRKYVIENVPEEILEGIEEDPLNKESSLDEVKREDNRLEDIAKGPSYLYNNTPEKFRTAELEKGGSSTTLFGESLKGKAIQRHIFLDNYLLWNRLFLDYELWREKGFDYVPIEPIFSVKPGKEIMIVDVDSKVLGPNFKLWIQSGGKFIPELKEQMGKIKKVIKEAGIDHGHDREHNFCLVFYKDPEGKPDLNRIPRIYLIDFDQIREIENI